MEQEFDLRYYLMVARKWWWILAVGMLSTVLVAWFFARSEKPTYLATAKVLVQKASSNPGINDVAASQQLAAYYTDLIKTRPIQTRVIQELGLPYDEDSLAGKITVQSQRALIFIQVNDGSPVEAAALANAVARASMDEIRERQLLELARFQASLDQFGINRESNILASQASALSLLTMAEEAFPPTNPSNANKSRNLILAGLLGAVGSGLIIFSLERLDTRVKSPDELKALTKLEVLGSILRFSAEEAASPIVTVNGHRQNAPAQSFKFLRTNLQFAALSREGFRTLLVTSAGPGEGKTTTAVNLAATLAGEGKSVILVEADLRRPSVHRFLGLDRRTGLTNVILGDVSLDKALAETPIHGLRVLMSGPLPPDPTTVLQSQRFADVAARLRDLADYVIIDTPPVLAVADALVLIPRVDGVLFVVDPEATRRETLKQASEALRQGNPGYMAVVLNKVSSKARSGYYYYYYYYYHYYNYGSSDGDGRKNHKLRSLVRALKAPFAQPSRSRRRRSSSRHSSDHADSGDPVSHAASSAKTE